jgi:transcriptional regulator with XRE-family HTH domain
MKGEERGAARRLRADEGKSIRAIAAELGVAVSSVSVWVRDVALTPAQEAELRRLNPRYSQQRDGTDSNRRRRREERLEAQAHGRELARRAEPLHQQGVMLYWAEGSKARNAAKLTNADPDLLDVFVRFLRHCYHVPPGRCRLSVNCHLGHGLTLEDIEGWWLQRLGLPPSCVRAATVNRPSAASKFRRGHVLPYGTARIAVHSTFIVQSIYGAIQEYAGIDRPEWLDGRPGDR